MIDDDDSFEVSATKLGPRYGVRNQLPPSHPNGETVSYAVLDHYQQVTNYSEQSLARGSVAPLAQRAKGNDIERDSNDTHETSSKFRQYLIHLCFRTSWPGKQHKIPY